MPLSEDKAAEMLSEVSSMMEDAISAFRVKRLDRVLESAILYRGFTEVGREGSYSMGAIDPMGEANEGINIARMLVKAAVAQTMKQFPSIEIPAAKDDQKARARADMTEKLAKTILRRIEFDELHRSVSWSKQTGAAWLKVCWNTQAGRALPQDYDGFTDEEEKARWEDDGFGDKAAIQLFEGDVSVEFVPTTDGFPDPAAHTIKEMQHFFHVKLLPARKLEDRFPVDYFGETTKGRFAGNTYREEKLGYTSFAGDDNFQSVADHHSQSDGNVLCELIEFWEMPTLSFPLGRFLAFSGGMILACGPNPYSPTRLPFVLIQGDNLVPGSLYADGVIADVRSLQYSTNRAANKLREHLDKMLNVHMLVPRGSGIDKNSWGDKTGQVVEYVKGYKPEPLEVRDIPSGMFTYLDEQIRRAQSVTGYTDVGRGDAQTDLSGRAVAFYTENETAMREPDMAAYRRSLLEVARHGVHLYRQFADDGRLLHIVGENGKVELAEFLSEEFDWENDFVPELYTARPQSRAARVSEVLEFMGANLFEDGPGPERARKLLGESYSEASTYDPFIRDKQRARRENLIVLREPTAQIQVQTYDTHEIHMQEHREFMRTPEFESLPDYQKEVLFTHDELHELMAAGADQALLQAQHGPPPTPPGPEGAPPGLESPPNGGAPMNPAPPPTIAEFNASDSSQQSSFDQQ